MTKKLNEMKASEKFRIKAAVFETFERAQFEAKDDVALQEVPQSDKWKMVFVKNKTDLEELRGIRSELGTNFAVGVLPNDKNSIRVSIEAPGEDFVRLIYKKDADVTTARQSANGQDDRQGTVSQKQGTMMGGRES